MAQSPGETHTTRRQVVFVCGTPHGGAVDSTVALAALASNEGLDVSFIVAATDPYAVNQRLCAGIVRVSRVSRALGRLAWHIYGRRYGRFTVATIGSRDAHRSIDVVGAAEQLLRPHAVVVVNSLRAVDLRRMVLSARRSDVTLVWYLREESSLASVPELGGHVDVLIANARPLAEAAASLSARPCHYIPSVVSLDDLCEPSDRRVLLLINAVPSHGLEEAIAIGAARPNDHVVLQESWPLSSADKAELLRRIAALPNIEFRTRAPRSQIFRDTRILLLPHSSAVAGNRPRVSLEAQQLGVPVIAFELPGLIEMTPSAELRVRSGAPLEEWLTRIDLVDAQYERFESAAREFAARELPEAREIWSLFSGAACIC